ncbi:MAG: host specificity factor TipJ family phage tail protein [Shewanella sp.]
MIRIYPSKLEGEQLENHSITSETTINKWLADNVQGYEWRESPPISVHVNGVVVDPAGWHDARIVPTDDVDIYPEPKGVFAGAALLAAVFAGVAVVAMNIARQPSLPKQAGTQGRGDNLKEASIKGNKIKINSPVREVFGRRKVFPDYLVPNHRYFESERVQVVETHLSIGVGEFDVPANGTLVGDTPIASLGDSASLRIYAPGESVAGDSRCEWWHSASEVGGTSTGTSGLEVSNTFRADPTVNASTYILSGNTITIPSGAGTFPSNWEPGMILRVDARYPYVVTDGVGAGVRDIISGDFAQSGLEIGDTIEFSGGNAGNYTVHEVDWSAGTMTVNRDNGAPGDSLVPGPQRIAIGYRGLRYRITAAGPSTITLERLRSEGGTDINWPGFPDLTIGDAVLSLDASTQEGGWVGTFSACPSGELTSKIEWDWFFPGGIIFIGDDGWIAPPFAAIVVTMELQYRDADIAGAWTSNIESFSSNKTDQLGYTRSANLPYPMRPEVRVRRIGAKSSNPQVQDTVQWYGLRSLLTGKTSYSGITSLAIKVAGGGRIAAQSEQLVSVLATRKLPVRIGGTWSAPVATRDIAPVVAYIAKSLGYTDGDLDLAELDRLDAIWRARGDTFDQSFESVTTAKESINSALSAGFSEMTIERGRIRPVRDEPRTVREQMYTPQNCTEVLTRDFKCVTPDEFDGVDVEYTDGRTWQAETVECRLPGDLGIRVEKIQVQGVTSRTKAWRIGMRARMAQKHRRYTYSTATELDALNSRYLSYVVMADDVPGYGKSSILEAYGDLGGSILLESSEPFDWENGASHVVGIRRPDGTVSGPHAATKIDEYRLTIPALDFVPDVSWKIEPPHLLFGTTKRWAYPALVTEISPRGDNSVSIRAINYAPEVYQYDDAEPPG